MNESTILKRFDYWIRKINFKEVPLILKRDNRIQFCAQVVWGDRITPTMIQYNTNLLEEFYLNEVILHELGHIINKHRGDMEKKLDCYLYAEVSEYEAEKFALCILKKFKRSEYLQVVERWQKRLSNDIDFAINGYPHGEAYYKLFIEEQGDV